jgi:hypothetical protein
VEVEAAMRSGGAGAVRAGKGLVRTLRGGGDRSGGDRRIGSRIRIERGGARKRVDTSAEGGECSDVSSRGSSAAGRNR